MIFNHNFFDLNAIELTDSPSFEPPEIVRYKTLNQFGGESSETTVVTKVKKVKKTKITKNIGDLEEAKKARIIDNERKTAQNQNKILEVRAIVFKEPKVKPKARSKKENDDEALDE